jgi:hypothetical protein
MAISISVFLGWLSDENNYAQWKSQESNGAAKTVLSTEISCLPAASGILLECSRKDIHMKINSVKSVDRYLSD